MHLYKKACLEIQKGNISLVLEDMKNEPVALTNEEYLKLVGYIYNAIQQQVTLNTNDLATLIIYLHSKIDVKDEKQQYKFLCYYYHIFKYLFEQNAYDEILQASHCLYPHWLSFNHNQISIYESLQILIHNHIFSNSKQTTARNLFTPYIFVWIHISKKIIQNQTTKFYQNLNKYLVHVKETELIMFLDKLFALLEDLPHSKEMYPDVMKLYVIIPSLIFQKYNELKERQLYLAKYFISITNLVEPLLKDTPILTHFLWFKNMFKMLFFKQHSPLHQAIAINCQEFEQLEMREDVEEIVLIVCELLKLYSDNLKFDENIFETYLTKEALINYFQFLDKLGGTVCKFKKRKLHSGDCNCVFDRFNATRVSNIIGVLLLQAVKNKINLDVKLLKIDTFFERNLQYIEYIKEKDCKIWKNLWKEIGIYIYNVSILLEGQNSVIMLSLFAKSLMHLEGVRNCEIFEDALQKSLFTLSISCKTINDHYSALKWLSVALFLNPSLSNKCVEAWTQVKYKSRTDPLCDKLTIRGILRKNSTELRPLFGEEETTSETNLTAAIITEIKAYYKYWPNREALELAFTDLLKICSDIFIKAETMCLMSNGRLPFITDLMQTSLKRLIKEFKVLLSKKSDRDHLCYIKIVMGHLYLVDYRFKRQKMLEENKRDMDQVEKLTKKISEVTLAESAVKDVDPNDECDLVSSYNQLKLNQNMSLISLLRTTVSYWKTAFEELRKQVDINKNQNIPINEAFTNLKTLDCLEGIAYEYRLNNHTNFALEIWQLFLRISRTWYSPSYLLKSIGNILEIIEADANTELLQTEAEKCIEKLNTKESELNEAVLIYYIGKCVFKYRNRSYYSGYGDYKTAEMLLERFNAENGKLSQLQARFLCIKALYLSLPCAFNIVDHTNETIYGLTHQALVLATTNYHGTQVTWISEMLANILLLEIALTVGTNYKMMLKPRETRCYLRNYVVVSQKQLLPLTTARFLVTLAFSDLQSARLDDCASKLEGIAHILCISPPSLAPPANKCASPYLNANPKFEVPLFHVDSCDCFKCQSLDYWCILFQKLHLETQLLVYREEYKSADEFYKGVYEFYKTLFLKCISRQHFPFNIERYFCRNDIYPAFLLDYISFCILMENLPLAKDLNQELKDLFLSQKCNNSQILTQFTLHTLNLFYPIIPSEEVMDGQVTGLLGSEEQQPQFTKFARTPESKFSVAPVDQCFPNKGISAASSSEPERPKRFSRQKIPFPLRDMGDSSIKDSMKTRREKRTATKPKEIVCDKNSGDQLPKSEKENSSAKANKLSNVTVSSRTRRKKT